MEGCIPIVDTTPLEEGPIVDPETNDEGIDQCSSGVT
jgi:hypothetical protein